jgi:WD40 repeat protein
MFEYQFKAARRDSTNALQPRRGSYVSSERVRAVWREWKRFALLRPSSSSLSNSGDNAPSLFAVREHTEPVKSVAFDHAGDLLASGSWDDRTLLWNPITGRQIVGFSGYTYGLHFTLNLKSE